MEELTFNTPSGQPISRDLLVGCLNTGSMEEPIWSPLGNGVDSSSEDYDWGEESSQDILGKTRNTLKKPVITQGFDALPLEADDTAARKIWNLGIREQNAQALANQDMLIIHVYAGFAERYDGCAVRPTSLGGDGGSHITMNTEVTYGGTRTLGSATNAGGKITFTPDPDAENLRVTTGTSVKTVREDKD